VASYHDSCWFISTWNCVPGYPTTFIYKTAFLLMGVMYHVYISHLENIHSQTVFFYNSDNEINIYIIDLWPWGVFEMSSPVSEWNPVYLICKGHLTSCHIWIWFLEGVVRNFLYCKCWKRLWDSLTHVSECFWEYIFPEIKMANEWSQQNILLQELKFWINRKVER
jgi:hypothetical protein